MKRAWVILACAALGCPSPAPKRAALSPITGAPPARRLEVVNSEEKHAITVSSGVAFAVMVSDTCDATSSPTLAIADPSILREHPLARGPSKRAFALVAVRAGTTTVTIKAECATQAYEVTVLPQ
ncbi:MAG: hypothetical protein HYV09_38480 [Deltaproteobacteria bacterium]|nr:hypothetical protein [Deltaproteobacteria bacterium]